jgi:sulfur carrier protein ThiS
MSEITLDVWLYGELARYAGDPNETTFANPHPKLQTGSTISDLLAELGMNTEERGITFINGELAAMPGMQPDLQHVLKEGDRVAFFHLRAMWPFQYRNGIKMVSEMQETMEASPDAGIHHAYK